MKKIIFIFLCGIVLYCPNTYAQNKIAYIDFQYIISQVRSAEDVQVEIQKLASDWTNEIVAMTDTLTSLEKDIETVSLTLSKSGREILEKRISDKRQKIAAFQEQKFSPVTGELYKKQQELLQPLIDRVRRAIDNVRLREKIDVIFDVSAGNPVSIDKKYDVTVLVIDELGAVGLTVKEQAVSTESRTNIPSGGQREIQSGTRKVQPGKVEEKGKTQQIDEANKQEKIEDK
ncbi:OmpH family outer membrane protein [bacterium]|nr:OmpH family outer membrane protein [bacterium]